jgi:acyl carrier protein
MTGFPDVLAAVLEVPVAEMNDDVGPATHDTWTSIKHLQLIVALEDEYGVALTRQEIRSIRSVGDIRRILRGRGIAL